MDAAMHGHAEVIKLLLEAGATAIKTKEVSQCMASQLTLYCGNTIYHAHRCSCRGGSHGGGVMGWGEMASIVT